MQSSYTGFVTSAEWRWVIFVGVALVSIAFIPFLWVLIIGIADSPWQFMGALHHYHNGAAQLARVVQGAEGDWLTKFLHTPDPQTGTLIDPLYALLGQVSRLTGLSPIAVFHAARVGAALFMYLAIYQLAATIWMRVRTRRVFFILASVGSGFGWLLVPLTQTEEALDVTIPQAFPFMATLVNVHLPLAIACLALLASVIIMILRPGQVPVPRVGNGGGIVFLVSLMLTLLYPLAVLTIGIAFAGCIALTWYAHKRADPVLLRWLIWLMVPALPFLAYDLAVLRYNTVSSEMWAQQINIQAPNPIMFALSFGFLLMLALPGIYRAVRRFEPDGDQFMLVWALVILVLVYVPFGAQLAFVIGFTFPLVYFATRSIEDVWFAYVRRRWRLRVMVAFVPLVAATNLFVLLLPLFPVSANNFDRASGMLLERDYLRVFTWLEHRVGSSGVVMAAPDTSVWLPVWSRAQVVYAFPAGTLNATERRRAVMAWYQQSDVAQCEDILRGTYGGRTYMVSYVLIGPQEQDLGSTVCDEVLEPVGWFGAVRVYAYRPERSEG